MAFGNSLAVNFCAYGLHTYSTVTGFVRLTPGAPSQMAAADVDGDGNLELAATFSGSGLYLWNGTWSRINTVEPQSMMAFGNSLAIDFGSLGIYTYSTDPGFVRLTTKNPDYMASADVDSDGTLELAASFSGLGVSIWDGYWRGVLVTTQQPDFLNSFCK